MAQISEEQFLQKYGNFLVQAWANPSLKKKFKAEPAKVLTQFGLDPEGAKIKVLKPGEPNSSGEGKPTAESQARLWNKGKQAGTIEFYFPENPPTEDVGTGDLSDKQLEAIAGGVGDIYCCCSPCCCC